MSTQPDPDDYDMSSKRDRKKFERKSKKWTKSSLKAHSYSTNGQN